FFSSNIMTKVNAYGDVENLVMTCEDWNLRWKKNQLDFHFSEVYDSLLKHEHLLLEKANCSVFVPLCGKSVDMKYLADKSHRVVGLEFSEIAIQDFFAEQNIKFTVEKHPSHPFNIYRSSDSAITIYQGDLFQFNSNVAGKFDAVWDRGSFCAMQPSQQNAYCDVIYQVLNPGSRYLLNTFIYDQTKYPGPPQHTTDKEISELFNGRYDVKILEVYENLKPLHMSWGLDSFQVRNVFLVKK
uniref:thiopurine S-methyltransferase n=1 Tax=Ciona savignyi TaxID=51511 RepID=H2Z3J6_CIOSA